MCPHQQIAPNRLWIARKQAGYPLKWVCALLGKHSLSTVSEYERGTKVPTFIKTSLKIELVYRKSLAELFPALSVEVAEEVAAVKRRNPHMQARDVEVSEYERPNSACTP